MTVSAANPAKPGEYHVARPRGVCVVSERVIAPGEKFMAALRETPDGLERLDVSPEEWDNFDRSDLLGYWQAVMPKADEKKKVFLDDEVLCALFERLAEATEPNKLAFRFVLGLILMRKRLVIYETTRRQDGVEGFRDLWIVRMKNRQERLELIDPKLDENRIMEVTRQLGEILNEEL